MIRRGLSALFWVWVGLLILLKPLWVLTGETNWLLVLFRYAPPALYCITHLGACLLAWLARVRHGTVGALLGVLVIWVAILDFRLNWVKAPTSGFRVVSLNVQAGLGGPLRVGEFLATTGSDLIGLQEARKPSVAPGPDPVPTIQQVLKGYFMVRGGERGELVILSRHPIVECHEWPLGGLSTCLEAVIDYHGRPVRALNVHFMTGDPQGELRGQGAALPRRVVLSARTRTVQAEALRDLVLQSPLPTVVTGDFNSPPTGQAYAILSTVLEDVFGRSGLGVGFTYSTVRPLWRIDYVWSRGLQPLSARVVNAAVSDHRAVICEVRLGAPGR